MILYIISYYILSDSYYSYYLSYCHPYSVLVSDTLYCLFHYLLLTIASTFLPVHCCIHSGWGPGRGASWPTASGSKFFGNAGWAEESDPHSQKPGTGNKKTESPSPTTFGMKAFIEGAGGQGAW